MLPSIHGDLIKGEGKTLRYSDSLSYEGENAPWAAETVASPFRLSN
ncbi:MAG: hypothetical protein IKE24_06880 [Clostridia bacterium]|nr:hypothetical protein [Clostridia bacterium]